MTVSLRDTFHTAFAKQFYQDVVSGRADLHCFIGNVVPWGTTDLPPTYVGTTEEEMATRKNLVMTKRFSASDICFVAPRYDWATGTVYAQYDSSQVMKGQNFFVLTSDKNVYKCLWNNGGSQSTSMPTGRGYQNVTTSDGYIWKFMYTIPTSLVNRFLTSSFVPVTRSTNDNFYGDGQISSIQIVSGGIGYLGGSLTNITVSGGSPTTPAVLVPEIDSNGSISKVLIKNAGAGYTSAPTLTVVSATGTGKYPGNATAKLTAVILNGALDRVLINDPGLNLANSIQTTLSVTGDGSGAVLVPYIESGVITDVIIQDPGSGYSYASVTAVSATNPATSLPYGSGASISVSFDNGKIDTAQSIIEQTAVPGSIEVVAVVSGGANYLSAPTVVITGDGLGATAVATLNSNGAVGNITVTNVGSNYSWATVSFADQSGTGATARAIISPTTGHGFDAINELYADSVILATTINNDTIQGIKVKNGYRQYGVLKNIDNWGDDGKFQGTIGTAAYLATFSTTTNIVKNDYVLVNETDSYLVLYISGNDVLLIPQNGGVLLTGSTGKQVSTNVAFTVTAVTNPSINSYTGDLLYVNNHTQIEHQDQQSLTLRTVITL